MDSVIDRLRKKAKPFSKYGRDPDSVRSVNADHIRILEKSMEANLAGNAGERASDIEAFVPPGRRYGK